MATTSASEVATIRLSLAGTSDVRVELYDAVGRRVRHVLEGRLEARVAHGIDLDLTGLPPAVYFIRVRVENPRGVAQASEAVSVIR